MEKNKILFENYGLNPPENSRPFWEDNHAFTEDKTVSRIDLQISLQKLNPDEREIILYFNQGYSIRQIAEIIDIPVMTVQHIKERAISKLKEMMNGKLENIFI